MIGYGFRPKDVNQSCGFMVIQLLVFGKNQVLGGTHGRFWFSGFWPKLVGKQPGREVFGFRPPD